MLVWTLVGSRLQRHVTCFSIERSQTSHSNHVTRTDVTGFTRVKRCIQNAPKQLPLNMLNQTFCFIYCFLVDLSPVFLTLAFGSTNLQCAYRFWIIPSSYMLHNLVIFYSFRTTVVGNCWWLSAGTPVLLKVQSDPPQIFLIQIAGNFPELLFVASVRVIDTQWRNFLQFLRNNRLNSVSLSCEIVPTTL